MAARRAPTGAARSLALLRSAHEQAAERHGPKSRQAQDLMAVIVAVQGREERAPPQEPEAPAPQAPVFPSQRAPWWEKETLSCEEVARRVFAREWGGWQQAFFEGEPEHRKSVVKALVERDATAGTMPVDEVYVTAVERGRVPVFVEDPEGAVDEVAYRCTSRSGERITREKGPPLRLEPVPGEEEVALDPALRRRLELLKGKGGVIVPGRGLAAEEGALRLGRAIQVSRKQLELERRVREETFQRFRARLTGPQKPDSRQEAAVLLDGIAERVLGLLNMRPEAVPGELKPVERELRALEELKYLTITTGEYAANATRFGRGWWRLCRTLLALAPTRLSERTLRSVLPAAQVDGCRAGFAARPEEA